MFQSHDSMLPYPPRPLMMDRRWKANVELAPNCPRCASPNTKFCYYNNYSLSQPRYFCKGCRRYWTKGGSLRNVPVGGGCRKNRRGRSVRPDRVSTTYSPTSYLPDDPNPTIPLTRTDGSDIDLAVVFSNFLNNQDSCSDPGLVVPELPNDQVDRPSFDMSNSTNPNYDSPPIHFPQEHNTIECQRPYVAQMIGGPTQVFVDEFDSTNKYYEPRISRSLLSDVVVQDDLWSDAAAVPNISWQPPQLQGFEPVPDDQSTFYPNQLHGNWSSFDISNYGV